VRLGVLIHAESVEPESWAPLARLLADRGEISVVNAYADWSSPAMAGWLPVLRRHGIQVRHQFRARSTQDPALVAITMDAIELLNAGSLDGLVLPGQFGSALPLIQRLRERGLVVVVAGPPATPLDIRAACSEFIDLRSLHSYVPDTRPGRHRA
jgi:uncharacterized LabA/DUF88 family protein